MKTGKAKSTQKHIRKGCAIGLYVGLIAVLSGDVKFAISQSRTTTNSETTLRFEIVSIRPAQMSEGAGIRILPDGYQAKGVPLEETILVAYFPAPYFKHRDQLKGLPPWAENDSYDIEAKVAPGDVTQWQRLNQNMMKTSEVLQKMLQSILSERCKLRLHSNDSSVDGYVLTTGRKIRLEVQASAGVPLTQGMPLLDGGKAIASLQDGRYIWAFYNTSMPALANFLQLSAQGPVEDETGLPDKYHFLLAPLESSLPVAGNSDDPASPVPWELSSLGLKVSRTKLEAKIWTVDNIQRPSPN